MIIYPNAKINLGLNTVFYPVMWRDALEIIENKNATKEIEFSSSGLTIEGNPENNLIVKAYTLLNKEFSLPAVKIHLHKVIPMGAGLGGGSADAAFTLKLLNDLFALKISTEQLKIFATSLGSDCAFFIENKPKYATQRGDVLEPIDLKLGEYKIVVVWPGIHSDTAAAYAGIIPAKPIVSCKETVMNDIHEWKNNLKNDFEETVFKKFPEIKKVKEELYKQGAIYSAMSGSGSAVFAFFEKEIPPMSWPKHYHVYHN